MDGKQLSYYLFNSSDGSVSVSAILQNDTLWLSQKGMATLFGVTSQTITYHLKEVYDSQELDKGATCKEIRIVQPEGDRDIQRKVKAYNLDAIISVGYRVNSKRATEFRKWATGVLREFMIKGFVLDDERLKQGESAFGRDYFRELLERVRSIRASERRIWQQVTDIFAECSIDYDKHAITAKRFYAMVQNKFHYAIAGSTAAEIVFERADRNKEHMGLTTWKNSPDGRILKSDVSIAKNYLSEKQIRKLERAVSGYFDYIEDLIERERVFTMEDFATSINEFLEFRKYDILEGKGKISHEQAKQKAEAEYDAFNKHQKITSDFDKEVAKMIAEASSVS